MLVPASPKILDNPVLVKAPTDVNKAKLEAFPKLGNWATFVLENNKQKNIPRVYNLVLMAIKLFRSKDHCCAGENYYTGSCKSYIIN